MITMSRRQAVLSAAFASFAFGLDKPLALIEPAFAQKTPAPANGIHKYKIGSLECATVYDGIWEKAHDPAFFNNASTDDVKSALRAAGLTDEFVPIPFVPLVINTGKDLILFDAGTGGQVLPTAGKLRDTMKAGGLDPAKVTKVMISHFHPDHIFGLMEKGTNAQVYPNAEIVVSTAEYKFWTDPAVVEKLNEARRPLAKRIQATFPTWKNIRQVDGEAEVAPGVRIISAPGHTPGHIAFHVSSGNSQMIYSGDTFYHPAFSMKTPQWHGAFDHDGPTAETSRRAMAERLVRDKILVTGYHFPWPAAGTIARDGNTYALIVDKA